MDFYMSDGDKRIAKQRMTRYVTCRAISIIVSITMIVLAYLLLYKVVKPYEAMGEQAAEIESVLAENKELKVQNKSLQDEVNNLYNMYKRHIDGCDERYAGIESQLKEANSALERMRIERDAAIAIIGAENSGEFG